MNVRAYEFQMTKKEIIKINCIKMKSTDVVAQESAFFWIGLVVFAVRVIFSPVSIL